VKCIFEDIHHTVWIGTQNAGLLQYNREKDTFSSIINGEKNKQDLHYNYTISCIFQDAEENIWLGTDKGINIFNPYHRYFQSIHHEENDSLSLPENEIQDFIQTARGDILVGTWGGGITVYDSTWNFKKNISFSGPYEHNLVWCFIQNDDGTIWVGCQHGFIHIYNPGDKSIRTIRPPEMDGYTIRCMAKDKKGNIWMGLQNGKITKWDKQENKFYSYNDSSKGISQTFNLVWNIFFDSKQRCWVGTENGLKQFDTEKRMYSAIYLPEENNPHSISSGTIQGIEEYDDSTLVIGTLYGDMDFLNTHT
jgi:ligand-binding sensor domain-containing protein